MDWPRDLAPDDALAQPTRGRLFALLEELRRPVLTAELAELVGLHANGVRLHLERMETAGLVQRTRARHGRGRPSDAWTISPTARPGGRPPEGYRELGRWLARALSRPRPSLESVEATGREIGRELAPAEPGYVGPSLESVLGALGFQPELESDPPARLTVCLGNCPYRDAVRENQPAICSLHRGITVGLLERLDPEATMTGFTPKDPDLAGCTIEIRLQPSGPTP